jgi:S1-C subfamily serine protease
MTVWTRAGLAGLTVLGAAWALSATAAAVQPPAPGEVREVRTGPNRAANVGDAYDTASAALVQQLTNSQAPPNANFLYRTLIDSGSGDGQVFFSLNDLDDETLGATLEPVAEPLRSQLGLEAGQGLLVASLAGDGPAAQAGLKAKDILVRLAEKPLGKADDLRQALKESGEKDLTLEVLRAGKPTRLKVRPVYRVTLGPAGQEKTDYYIGVPVNPVDDTLRAHLDLPAGQGLVVDSVAPGSPAEKAGVKPHDVLLQLGDKPLTSTEVLVAQIQATGGKPTPLKLLRAGKPLTVEITPEKRQVQTSDHRQRPVRLWSVPHLGIGGPGQHNMAPGTQHLNELYRWQQGAPGTGWNFTYPHQAGPLDKRIDTLDQELKALRKSVDDLREAIKSGSKDRGRD